MFMGLILSVAGVKLMFSTSMISSLISLEFIASILFCLLFGSGSASTEVYFAVSFLTIMVCEGVLGVCILKTCMPSINSIRSSSITLF
nr:NADH dehydrogenase subunit 4L [Linognathus vituli]